MPLRNRVTPFGDIVASDSRGTFMGNRGCLHDANRILTGRRWTTKAWVTCLLSFRGRRRQLMRPGYYTELFFLDEATALAAGHRPCAECRRASFREFARCWGTVSGGPAARVTAPDIDRTLHASRVDRQRRRIRYKATLATLPDGAIATMGDDALLKWNGLIRPWSLDGYGPPAALPSDIEVEVEVLTPRPIVEALRAGYRPQVHSSAA